MINPYAVACADILYLCNTGGYLERFVYIVGIIMWAKRNGVNLLQQHSRKNSLKQMSAFLIGVCCVC